MQRFAPRSYLLRRAHPQLGNRVLHSTVQWSKFRAWTQLRCCHTPAGLSQCEVNAPPEVASREPDGQLGKDGAKGEGPKYKDYRVPLPDGVVSMLNAARLCTLATNFNGLHLSLMNFTYVRSDEVLVLCTRRNTKKFLQMTNNGEVAVLINDFPLLRSENGLPPESGTNKENKNGKNGTGSSCSITLNGKAEALGDTDPLAVKYRAAHKANNAEYAHFIEGPDIAVIVIRFETASICDFKDQVKTWARADAVNLV